MNPLYEKHNDVKSKTSVCWESFDNSLKDVVDRESSMEVLHGSAAFIYVALDFSATNIRFS